MSPGTRKFCSLVFYPHEFLQRVPYLPLVSKSRPPVCAILDCCVLWLRHNLHKRLEVYSYLLVSIFAVHELFYSFLARICIRICYQVIWYLQKQHVHPGMSDPHSQGLYLLDFHQNITGWNFGERFWECSSSCRNSSAI